MGNRRRKQRTAAADNTPQQTNNMTNCRHFFRREVGLLSVVVLMYLVTSKFDLQPPTSSGDVRRRALSLATGDGDEQQRRPRGRLLSALTGELSAVDAYLDSSAL